MVKLLKQFLILTASLLIVLAGGGFGIYQHYCACDDINKFSAFIQTTDCHQNETEQCCSEIENKVESNSCELQDTVSEKSHLDFSGDSDFCSTEYIYLKTDIFDAVKSAKKEYKFIAFFITVFATESEQLPAIENLAFCVRHNIPPPKFGKDLLVFTHQLKIANTLV